MKIFIENSPASSKNPLSEDIDLQGEWRVALSKITFPIHFNNVTDTKIVYYKKDKVRASLKVAKDKLSRPYDGEKIEITKGEDGEMRNYSTKSIGMLILIISLIASTPLPNIFQFGCIIGKALPLRAHGYVCSIEPNHCKVFSNLNYKKLLVNNIQSIPVNLRTETGRLVTFAG